MKQSLKRAKKFQGSPCIPGDKSISHRGLIFGGIAKGKTEVHGLLESEDVQSTARCLSSLGVQISRKNNTTFVEGVGGRKLSSSELVMDCGNSGTTIRILTGVLAGYSGFRVKLQGDESLNKRPMQRVIDPLRKMGANIRALQNECAPIEVIGRELHGIEYELPVASAQVKTALILAGLRAQGETVLSGKIMSRDHSEKLLPAFGAQLRVNDQKIIIPGQQLLQANKVIVPGDPSTAAFWMAGAALIPNSHLKLKNISLNPTRLGFLRALIKMGANINVDIKISYPEPIGDVEVKFGDLKGIQLSAEDIPDLIDELPLLAVIASQSEGETEIRGAEELRVKESDRLEAIALNLRSMGVELELFPDGLKITGPQKLTGSHIQTFFDHRIAMAFSIAALVADGETIIDHAECVAVSYPEFFMTLQQLAQL